MFWTMVCLSLFSFSNCLESISPCNLEESGCFTSFARAVYTSAMADVPEPIKLDLVEAASPNLTFTLRDSVASGYKSCVVDNAILKTADDSNVRIVLICPYLNMTGQYVMEGKLAHLPIRGKGDYEIETSDYILEINGKVKYINQGSEKYIFIDNFSQKADLKGAMRLDLKNLFDGNKELADPVHTFTKEHPDKAAQILDRPVFDKTMTIIVNNLNKQLRQIPVTKFVA